MTIEITSAKLGKLAIDTDRLLYFPEGIPGFRDIKEYALVEPEGDSPFYWLQAVEDPELAFVVTDPLFFVADYRPVYSEDEVQLLEVDDLSALLTLVLVTIPEGKPNKSTANLVAPICINPANRKGRQIILPQVKYSHQTPLFV